MDNVWQCIVGGMVPESTDDSHDNSETKSTNTDSSGSSSNNDSISSSSSSGIIRAGMLPTQIPARAKSSSIFDTAQGTTSYLEQTASTAVWMLVLALGAVLYVYCLQGMQGEAQQRHSDL